jgi:DNA-directed RNA polymerase sigma subunit (sigma70/sigma32)
MSKLYGTRPVWTRKRIDDLLDRRIAGETLASIGKSYGVSAERIRQVQRREFRELEKLMKLIHEHQ